MSKSHIGADLRRLVAERADDLCGYCLIHEDGTFFGCEVDHVISEKHGGPTRADNLAYACLTCNRAKGSDVGSIVRRTGEFVRFFNPRQDVWVEHFEIAGITVTPRTDIGEVTANILKLNDADRLLERELLQAVGRYPTVAALKRITRVPDSLDGNQGP